MLSRRQVRKRLQGADVISRTSITTHKFRANNGGELSHTPEYVQDFIDQDLFGLVLHDASPQDYAYYADRAGDREFYHAYDEEGEDW